MASYEGGTTTKNNEFGWGEAIVNNEGRNVLTNTNFMLRVEGVFDVPCRKISSFQRENEFEHIQEGGLNDYVHLRRKNITKPFTLTLERYTGYEWVDPLPLGYESILPMVLYVSRYPGLFSPIYVARTYMFTGCIVTGKTWGELDAEQSGLLVETIEIAYKEFMILNMTRDPNVVDK